MYLCKSQTYQIAGSLKFPFAFSFQPHLRVGGVHDGNQYVDHQDGHDDLVADPNEYASNVQELSSRL